MDEEKLMDACDIIDVVTPTDHHLFCLHASY
jgi:hypothetical protein